MRHHQFNFYTFSATLDLYINCNQEELLKNVRKKLKDKTIEFNFKVWSGCYYTLEHGDKQYRIVWIKNFDWSVASQALLIHELIHYVMAVFDDKGIPISKDNEETFAYFLEHIVGTVLWRLRALSPAHKKTPKKKT